MTMDAPVVDPVLAYPERWGEPEGDIDSEQRILWVLGNVAIDSRNDPTGKGMKAWDAWQRRRRAALLGHAQAPV
jgi:hypothetical protein